MAAFAATGVVSLLAGFIVMGTATGASAAKPENAKVVVCKYTGTPGSAETFHHFTETSVQTMPDSWVEGTFPFSWTEAQGNTTEGSYVIGYVGNKTGADCPGYVSDLLPVPETPVPTPADCDTGGTLTVGPVANVTVTVSGPEVSETVTATKTYTKAGTYTVTYTTVDPWKFDARGNKTVESYTVVVDKAGGDCPLSVPAFPTATAPTCDTNGSLTVTPFEDVTVTVALGSAAARTITQSTVLTTPGVYTVTYQAADGFVFDGDRQSVSAELTVLAATGSCPVKPGGPSGPGTPSMPAKPNPVVVSEADVVTDCDADEVVTTTTTTTTDWVFDQAAWAWVPGTPTAATDVASRPVTGTECLEEVPPVEPGETPDSPDAEPTAKPGGVKGVETQEPQPQVEPVAAEQPEAVPTAVDAGFGPVASTPQGSPFGQGLVGGGLLMLLLAGSMQMGRRERGAHEI